MRNDLDRHHLIMDVIDRVPGRAVPAAPMRQLMEAPAAPPAPGYATGTRLRHRAWIREPGTDLPEVADRTRDS